MDVWRRDQKKSELVQCVDSEIDHRLLGIARLL
jgi:hypothetical protein